MLRVAFVGAIAVAVAAAACKDKEREQATDPLAREGDAALVVLVDRAPGGVTFEGEEEPNDDEGGAQPLAVPGAVRGTLDGETDDDVYRIEVDAEIHLSALVRGGDDVDLVLDLTDEAGERMQRSDRAPAGHSEGVPNLPLEPGVYHVTVREFVRGRERGAGDGARTGPSAPYELVLEARAPETGYEVEPNDDPDEASEVEVDRDAFGFVGWHGDVDLWAIPLAGVLETDGLDISVAGTPWLKPALAILGPDGEVLVAREGRRGEPLAVHNLAPHRALGDDADDAEWLYVRISSPRSNPEEPYRLRVEQRDLEPDNELEPNHEPELATPLRDELDELDGERRGHLDLGDVDVYRLGASPGPRILYATVKSASGVRARLEVSVDGQTVAEMDAPGRGANATVSDVEVPAGRSAYVTVSGESSGAPSDTYELRWSLQ